jgi:4-carboxymuconolactone decarboxylase
MDERTTALVRLSASLTTDEGSQALAMDRAVRVDAAAAEEVLLQSYLFLGYPVALNALGLWRRRTGRPAPATGTELTGEAGDPGKPGEGEGPSLWGERGEAVCRAVYGDHYEALRELMERIHPELDRWAVVEGYGKVLGRPGLELRVRELCVAALLSGTTATRQLHSHLRGCLNVGASPDEVETMLDTIRDLTGPDRDREARRVWERVRTRWLGEGKS